MESHAGEMYSDDGIPPPHSSVTDIPKNVSKAVIRVNPHLYYTDRFTAPSLDGSLKTYKTLFCNSQRRCESLIPRSDKFGAVSIAKNSEAKLEKAGVCMSPGWTHVLTVWMHGSISLLFERNADEGASYEEPQRPEFSIFDPDWTDLIDDPKVLSEIPKGYFKKSPFDNKYEAHSKLSKSSFTTFKRKNQKGKDNYSLFEKFSGGHASVIRIKALDSSILHQDVVVKFVKKDDDMRENLIKEIKMLLLLPSHTNIARMIDYFVSRNECAIVYPMLGADLYTLMAKRKQQLPHEFCVSVLKDITSAIAFLAENGVINRDIKITNVVVDPDTSKATLIDFGMASTPFLGASEKIGDGYLEGYTRGSTPPEIIAGVLSGPLIVSDVWALGIIAASLFYTGNADLFVDSGANHESEEDVDTTRLGELLVQIKVFGTPKPDGIVWPSWFEKLPQIPVPASVKSSLRKHLIDNLYYDEIPSEKAFQFISRCLTFDPRLRPSASELLSDPLFDDLDERMSSEIETPYKMFE
jgi:serine/threonine protein kinase